jgi:lysophospholipase L1-like esterase
MSTQASNSGDAIARIMSRTPLPPPPPHDAVMLALADAMLDKTIDASMLASLATPELVAARTAQARAKLELDWPSLARYRAENAVSTNPDLVLIGDSITEIWARATPDMFNERILNRGVSGQTSAQILLRFYADVIELKPRAAHLLCGTNDIAGNTGPNTPEDFQRNIAAMADLAKANGIELVVASLTPTSERILWSPAAEPMVWIPYLNDWLRQFATARALRFIDYHAELADADGRLREAFSADGVHLTRAAYRLMQSLLERSFH